MSKLIVSLILVIIGYISYRITGLWLMMALIWNLFLALIPWGIFKIRQKVIHPFNYLLDIIWLLFLPNSFYMFTDLTHISLLKMEILPTTVYETTTYIRDIPVYIAFTVIILFAVMGVYLGCFEMYERVSIEDKKIQKILYPILSLLCGIGIYIGRFLRFNSWDLLRPIYLMKTFLLSIDVFALFYIVLISVLIYMTVMMYMQSSDR